MKNIWDDFESENWAITPGNFLLRHLFIFSFYFVYEQLSAIKKYYYYKQSRLASNLFYSCTKISIIFTDLTSTLESEDKDENDNESKTVLPKKLDMYTLRQVLTKHDSSLKTVLTLH